MSQQDLLETANTQLDTFRSEVIASAQLLRDFTRRMELILSQDRRNLEIRDNTFSDEFSAFCRDLRKKYDESLPYWQKTRLDLKSYQAKDDYGFALAVKSFALKCKALSRITDDFTTAYDAFNRIYKNYTLSKLPVWLLTACCEDLNNLTGKLLFLARELSKKTEKGS
ncbi:MAG: hypothetical protein IKC13_02320 [Elusimicrobiaceae bacterium]|nr:hypothetical protein [Elusimicrobiaceae bacterium]